MQLDMCINLCMMEHDKWMNMCIMNLCMKYVFESVFESVINSVYESGI
jgi:hypothetical protein